MNTARGQVRLGLNRKVSTLISQVRLGQVRLGRLGQVVQFSLGQFRLVQFFSCQVRSGQVRLGQVRLGINAFTLYQKLNFVNKFAAKYLMKTFGIRFRSNRFKHCLMPGQVRLGLNRKVSILIFQVRLGLIAYSPPKI